MTVSLQRDLDPQTKIWRYMALDKFIHLLDSQSLYFSTLNEYSKSDPFEGIPPVRIIKAIRDIVPLGEGLKKAISDFESELKAKILTDDELRTSLNSLAEPLRSEHQSFITFTTELFKGHVVNCWHANAYESEAMWKLYGDSHRGVAIQTTVGKLQSALASDEKIKICKVVYSDYHTPSNEALRHLLMSELGPVMKRASYSHEEEVRAYFLPAGFKVGLKPSNAKSCLVKLKNMSFMERVVVSPYTSEPYMSAVKAIAGKFQVECEVEESNLLRGVEGLFDLGVVNGLFKSE